MSHFTSTSDQTLQPHLVQVGDDLALEYRPPSSPSPSKNKRVLIIGGGVSGLTTAWVLLDAGFDVVVLADRWAPATPRITSQVAGALWEYPPAVCGAHTNAESLAKSKGWSMTSYHIFSQLSANDVFDHGIRMRISNFFFTTPVHELPQQLSKMHEIAGSGVHGFRRDSKIITEQGISPAAGLVDAYQHVAPVIDTDAYMVWLRSLVLQKGAKLQTAHISGDLLDYERRLLSNYDACAIVNATGLQSKELAGDPTVFPLRGGLIRVVNDGSRFPRITQALCVSHDDSNPDDEGFVFILPRNDNVLLLGGIAQENKWELDLTLDSPEMKRIRARCNAFIPNLENAQLDPNAPIVQGLRPLTTTNVKVMRDSRGRRKSKIVHNYGHGGSGFSFSFGCAAQVLSIVHGILREEQPMETEMLMAKL